MGFTIGEWQPELARSSALNNDAPQRYGAWLNTEAPDDAPLLVFWPGLGGSVKNALGFFNGLLPYFGAILVPDLQGFGLNGEKLIIPPSPETHIAQARQFLHQIALPMATTQERPVVLGGISLGALIQAAVVSQWQPCASMVAILGQCWVAPAFSAHPAYFGWRTQLIVGRQWVRNNRVCPLPYGMAALTRNPAALADPKHHQHMDDFRVPPGYLFGIRRLARRLMQQLPYNPLATWLAVPGQDVVCHPRTMVRAYWQLPPHERHQLNHWPTLKHDMLLEPELPQLSGAMGQWARQLSHDYSYQLLVGEDENEKTAVFS